MRLAELLSRAGGELHFAHSPIWHKCMFEHKHAFGICINHLNITLDIQSVFQTLQQTWFVYCGCLQLFFHVLDNIYVFHICICVLFRCQIVPSGLAIDQSKGRYSTEPELEILLPSGLGLQRKEVT